LNYHFFEVHEKENFTKTSAATVENEKCDLPSDVSKSTNSSMKSGGSLEKIEIQVQSDNKRRRVLSNNIHDGKKPNERENFTLAGSKKDQGGLNKGPSFLCPICCRYFWSANNLNYHISEVHEKEHFTKTSAAAVENEKCDLQSDISKTEEKESKFKKFKEKEKFDNKENKLSNNVHEEKKAK